MVRATQNIDPEICQVPSGMYGICFEEAEFYELGSGPMVRWFNGCVCNVYSDFVEVVRRYERLTPAEINTLHRWAQHPETFNPGMISHADLLKRAAVQIELST